MARGAGAPDLGPTLPMTRLHAEVMTAPQQALLSRLGPLAAARGFLLVGGTAVAIHLGHRRSVDLDWFREPPLDGPRLAAEFRGEGIALQVRSIAPDTLHASAEGVELSFLRFPYPLLETPVEWPPFGCRIAGALDLGCMKLSALAQRGARRDFIDLFALAEAGYPLALLCDAYQRKFGITDRGHLLAALVYFDDAEAEPMPYLLAPLSWDELKESFVAQVKTMAAATGRT